MSVDVSPKARSNAMNKNGFSIQKGLSLALCLSLASHFLPLFSLSAQAQMPEHLTGDVSVTVNPAHLKETIPIAGASRIVSMALRGVPLSDALCALAKKGGFNVVVDESVQGTVNTDLHNVTIQDALETLKASGNLVYAVQGGTLSVATADSARGKSFQKSASRIFSLKNANARVMADLLNRTVFAERNAALLGSGSSSSAPSGLTVTSDAQTNSLIVVGTPSDIKTVEEHLEALDKPRLRRTWRLSQANVLDVATILASSVFNEGQPVLIASNSGSNSSSSSSGSGVQLGVPTNLRSVVENIADGSGSGQTSQSNNSGGGGGGGGSSGSNSTTFNGTLMLRARAKQTQSIQISPNGPILIPDTRLNTLTLLGTAEQIAMVESFLPTLDRKMPQVVLEASLVEISEEGRRELGFNLGANNNRFSMGMNNVGRGGGALVNQAASNNIGRLTSSSSPLESILSFNTNPVSRASDIVYQLNMLISRNKAKMLANPTVITTSDNETLISIVDEVVRSVTITVGTNSGLGSVPTIQNNIGEAGIILNILPRVGADGTIALRVRPIVSSVSNVTRDRLGNLITLLSKREVLAQNTVLKDGETFVLGGLLQDTNTNEVARNPVLSSLPIVGALSKNSTRQKKRTELVVLITPHIVADDTAQQIAKRHYSLPGSPSSGGIVPVSLQGPSQPNVVLPPLERAQIIQDASVRKASMLESSNGRLPLNEEPAPPAQSDESSLPASSVSDEEVRAIMNKFK